MASDDRQASLGLPVALESAGVARRFVRERLADWDLGVDDDGVILMVSELVTNAGLHARSPATVRVVSRGDCLRVEVTDASAMPVALRPHEERAGAGRGLRIVDALAARWGVDPAAGGKTVWFEVVAAGAGRSST